MPNRLITILPKDILKKNERNRILILLGTFGSFWLILEPLNFFGIYTAFFSLLKWKGYLILVGISVTTTFISEFIITKKVSHTIEYITFFVVIESLGIKHQIRTSKNLKIHIFIRLYTDYLNRTYNSQESKLSEIEGFYCYLVGEDRSEIDSKKSFSQIEIYENLTYILKVGDKRLSNINILDLKRGNEIVISNERNSTIKMRPDKKGREEVLFDKHIINPAFSRMLAFISKGTELLLIIILAIPYTIYIFVSRLPKTILKLYNRLIYG